MSNFLTKILRDKNEWKSMEARADRAAARLPDRLRRDHAVHVEVHVRRWHGHRRYLEGLLGLFETCAAEGKQALDVTGADVAAFCDERLRGTRSSIDKWRESLNRDVLRQLGHAGPQD